MSESLYLTQLVLSLKESLNGGKISPENCMQLLSKGMIFVEKLAVLNGQEKKKLVIDALLQIMNEVTDDENQQDLLVVKGILESNVISDTVDLIVKASKKELDLNTVFAASKGCVGCIEALFGSRRR